MGFGIVGKVCVMCCCNSIISTTTIQVFAESVSFHSVILPLIIFLVASGTVCPTERNKKRGKRVEKERWSDRKRGRRWHISRPFSLTFVLLCLESHYEYQYEPMERKHSPIFSSSSHWAVHAHKKSIQVNVMVNLWVCVCSYL